MAEWENGVIVIREGTQYWQICYDDSTRNDQEVIAAFELYIAQNKTMPIHLDLITSRGREMPNFSQAIRMQNVILENIVHIKSLSTQNSCFDFFIRILLANSNDISIEYNRFFTEQESTLDQKIKKANQIASAIRSNNRCNNNGHIVSFALFHLGLNVETFQTIWDALLDAGVRVIDFHVFLSDNIDFITKLSTNTTLERLHIFDDNGDKYSSSEFTRRNLYDAIKVNNKLMDFRIDSSDSDPKNKEITMFKEMLRENTTLINVVFTLYNDNDEWNDLVLKQEMIEEINFHTEINYKWKQFKIMIKAERTAAAAAALNAGTLPPPPPLTVTDVAAAEKKKRFKMQVILNAFVNKPVLRGTIIFHLLTEYFDVFDNDTNKETNSLFLMLRRLRCEGKQKTTTTSSLMKSK